MRYSRCVPSTFTPTTELAPTHRASTHMERAGARWVQMSLEGHSGCFFPCSCQTLLLIIGGAGQRIGKRHRRAGTKCGARGDAVHVHASRRRPCVWREQRIKLLLHLPGLLLAARASPRGAMCLVDVCGGKCGTLPKWDSSQAVRLVYLKFILAAPHPPTPYTPAAPLPVVCVCLLVVSVCWSCVQEQLGVVSSLVQMYGSVDEICSNVLSLFSDMITIASPFLPATQKQARPTAVC